MSSIFSVDTNDTEHAALTPNKGLVGNAAFGVDAAAYGLELNNPSERSAITPSPDELTWHTSALTDSSYSTHSNPFISELAEDVGEYQTANHVDELTGLDSRGGKYLSSSYASSAGEIASDALASVSQVSGDLSFTDNLNPTRANAFKDDYTFASQSTATVQIDLESFVFDTYLQLIDPFSGSVLLSNDDIGASTNSQLAFTAQAGQQYTIRVTSYNAFATGGYDLTAFIDDEQSAPPNSPPNEFNSVYGYGLVDAASAVAAAVGRSPFSAVADIGGNQWNNDMINAPEVWNQGYTGDGITVAVIDSGVDIFHEDLRNNIWENVGEIYGDGIDNDGNGYVDDRYGWNFGIGQYNSNVLPGTNDIGQGHGTHVAGTIAAGNNGFGMTGVAYNSNIMALRLGDVQTDSQGRGLFVNGGDLAEAIYYAVNNGADVINMSLGGGDPTGSVRQALAYAAERNVIAVMASGNESSPTPSSPASYATDYGISVGAVTPTGGIPNFSNGAGFDSRMRHVMAPGTDIYSTVPGNTWDFQQGTSMAAPHVAGVVALMLSANRNLTHAQVRDILTGTTFSTSATAIAQIANNTSSEEWIVSRAPLSFNRWHGFDVESDHITPTTLSASTLEDANLLLSASSSSADAVYEFLLEQSVQFVESYTDDWQNELVQPLVDADLLSGAIS